MSAVPVLKLQLCELWSKSSNLFLLSIIDWNANRLPNRQRKNLAHSQLMNEVLSQLSSRFVPDVNMVKRRIESLIDREYLERVAEEPPTYGYIAWSDLASFDFLAFDDINEWCSSTSSSSFYYRLKSFYTFLGHFQPFYYTMLCLAAMAKRGNTMMNECFFFGWAGIWGEKSSTDTPYSTISLEINTEQWDSIPIFHSMPGSLEAPVDSLSIRHQISHVEGRALV